jgi:predicted metal-dependent TIM-barrel fold hydrolase
MRINDVHLHTPRMVGADMESISVGGVEAAVAPTEHCITGLNSAEAIFRYWNRLLGYEVSHAYSLGIKLFVGLAVPYYGVTPEGIEECLERLPEYYKVHKDVVVAVGETGLNVGIEDEVKPFRAHLRLAKKLGLPAIVHTACPNEPAEIVMRTTRQAIQICIEEDFPLNRVVLDETGLNTVDMRLKSGAMVNLGVCYDKLRPDDVADVVKKYPDKRDKFMISSMVGNSGGGYFSAPRAVLAMRMAGLKREEIEQVTWDNPRRFYKLPLD